MANPNHLKILKRGVDAWNRWWENRLARKLDTQEEDSAEATSPLGQLTISSSRLRRADLRGADLSHMDLAGINFSEVGLLDTDLTEANLVGAVMPGVRMAHCNLTGADLSNADLSGARIMASSMRVATLTRARLAHAFLIDVDLGYSRVEATDFTLGGFNGVQLNYLDLSRAVGLQTIKHGGPSSISIDTIYKSKGNIPKSFLRGCGVPEDFIVYMRSLVGTAIDFYSCFISYSSKDDHFAQRLYADLQAKNVRCWKFDENAKWGEPVWGEIGTAIQHYDKLVVICSEHSLQSPPVIREIERALQKEDREHKNVLFPVRIDDYLLDAWKHPRTADVVSKVIGDFRGWRDPGAYSRAFPRFLNALNRPSQLPENQIARFDLA